MASGSSSIRPSSDHGRLIADEKGDTEEEEDEADPDQQEEINDEPQAAPSAVTLATTSSTAPSKSKKLLNATNTDWENQDFQINQKFKLKIASWNVSGLRAWLEKGGKGYLLHEHPDIVCLQETKCKLENIPDEAAFPGEREKEILGIFISFFCFPYLCRLPPVLAGLQWTGRSWYLFPTNANQRVVRNRGQGNGRGGTFDDCRV